MSVLLLSDLHLPPRPSPLRDRFLAFLAGPARGARRVYLLGDLFEVWIGDDVGMADYPEEVEAIRALVAAGVPVDVQRGNRDFLLGRRFCAHTGARLLPDPCTVTLGGEPVLLSHGDRYCSDDRSYQRWRAFSRNPAAQAVFALLPRSLRERIADGVRRKSRDSKADKAMQIMDVNPGAIETAFRNWGVCTMIHGHTHRPDTHEHDVDGRACRRVVLPDWRPERMEYLRIADGKETLEPA